MFIRSAVLDDAEKILEIYAYYVRNTAISFECSVPLPEEFRERIRNTLKKYPYLVIEENGMIRGYAYAGVFKNREAYDHCCEVTIYLDRHSKGKGYGRALYEKLEEKLGEMGILNLYACIGDPISEDEYLTRNSEQFHQHMGYVKAGEFHKCGHSKNRNRQLNYIDSHTVADSILDTSSKNSNRRYRHAENRRIFKTVQSQCQNAPPL